MDTFTQDWKVYPLPEILSIDNGFGLTATGRGNQYISGFIQSMLQLGVTPLFIAPKKPWMNGSVEGIHSVFARKVWNKFDFKNLEKIDEGMVLAYITEKPAAHAGVDQSANTLSEGYLNGSQSSDPEGYTLYYYQWSQTGGTIVTLSDTTSMNPTFTAPGDPDVLTFSLTVVDNLGLSSIEDEV